MNICCQHSFSHLRKVFIPQPPIGARHSTPPPPEKKGPYLTQNFFFLPEDSTENILCLQFTKAGGLGMWRNHLKKDCSDKEQSQAKIRVTPSHPEVLALFSSRDPRAAALLGQFSDSGSYTRVLLTLT